jgi:hypothetical protein
MQAILARVFGHDMPIAGGCRNLAQARRAVERLQPSCRSAFHLRRSAAASTVGRPAPLSRPLGAVAVRLMAEDATKQASRKHCGRAPSGRRGDGGRDSRMMADDVPRALGPTQDYMAPLRTAEAYPAVRTRRTACRGPHATGCCHSARSHPGRLHQGRGTLPCIGSVDRVAPLSKPEVEIRMHPRVGSRTLLTPARRWPGVCRSALDHASAGVRFPCGSIRRPSRS